MSILSYIGITIIYIVGCVGVLALCDGIFAIKDRVNRKEITNVHNPLCIHIDSIGDIMYIWDDTKQVYQAQTIPDTEDEFTDDEVAINYFGQ